MARTKGTTTSLNLWVLAQVFGPETSVPNQLAPTDAPHIRRCLKAGLLTADRTTLTLTRGGRKALAERNGR